MVALILRDFMEYGKAEVSSKQNFSKFILHNTQFTLLNTLEDKTDKSS